MCCVLGSYVLKNKSTRWKKRCCWGTSKSNTRNTDYVERVVFIQVPKQQTNFGQCKDSVVDLTVS